jgi:signal transduction histidine kinase/ActR/RegA family two-component response regulator
VNQPRRTRSRSLSAQLLLTFVALVAATATGLSLFAYSSSIEDLIAAAADDAAVAARTRSRLLAQLLESRQRRAEGFLASVESVCSEVASRSRLAWAENCVGSMVPEFVRTEQASGAVLAYRGRRLQTAGGKMVFPSPNAGGLATVVADRDEFHYITHALRGELTIDVSYTSDEVIPLFADRSDLGAEGEILLVDAMGVPLTPARHELPGGALQAALERCQSGAEVRPADDRDYRGARVVASYLQSPVITGACIVAYRGYDEALAPAAEMIVTLVSQGVTFVLGGVLLSLVLARRIAAPVRRLADTARRLQGGEFGDPVPIAGPTEVRDLGRAFAAMATDLAELVAREQAARREAEAANRSKDQFLAMLSHELRTPLTAVLGWAHTLRTGRMEPDRVQRAAAAIERSAESQRRLIEDLLDVTGIAAGRVRVLREATRLAGVVAAAVDAVNPRALDKDVAIVTTIDDEGLVVFGDPNRLQQIVWNLLWNAVKFTPAGGQIRLRARAAGGLAELTVSDSGVGIEPEFLPHVFGWFRRADRDVRVADEGLGLGLALVRQLVELHGGTVRAASEGRNRGATFAVMLPLYQEDATPDAAPAGEGAAIDPVSLAGLRVLIVDDDSGSREAVRVLLEQVGAEVSTAASAAEARRHLHTTGADVLISDIAMVQESGYTLMESLRAQGLTIPGVALTAYARREDAEKAYAAGFDVHLPKPVDPAVLVSVLAAAIARSAPLAVQVDVPAPFGDR